LRPQILREKEKSILKF